MALAKLYGDRGQRKHRTHGKKQDSQFQHIQFSRIEVSSSGWKKKMIENRIPSSPREIFHPRTKNNQITIPSYLHNNTIFVFSREITGFLVLYRVHGLRTLEHMFPNLAVIRGDELILHYAFMLFQMNELAEVTYEINYVV